MPAIAARLATTMRRPRQVIGVSGAIIGSRKKRSQLTVSQVSTPNSVRQANTDQYCSRGVIEIDFCFRSMIHASTRILPRRSNVKLVSIFSITVSRSCSRHWRPILATYQNVQLQLKQCRRSKAIIIIEIIDSKAGVNESECSRYCLY